MENPDWSEWDRFVKPEYRRIESAQENEEGEVLNWEQDDWLAYFLSYVTSYIKSIYLFELI